MKRPARNGSATAAPTRSRRRIVVKRGKILYSLLLLTVLAGLLPLVFASYQLVGSNRDAMETSERLLQLDQTRSIASQARLYLQSMHNQVEAIARTFEIGSAARGIGATINEISDGESLISFIEDGRNILSLTISDRQGRGGHAGYQLQDPTLADYLRESFREALSGKTWVSPPLVTDELLDTVVIISAPIFDGIGPRDRPRPVAGVVSSMISLSPIHELVKSKTSTGREVYVVDSQGRLVSHSDPETLFTAADLSSMPIVQSFQSSRGQVSGSENFIMLRDGDQFAMVGTYTAIGDLNSPLEFLRDLGWGAMVQAEEEAVFYNSRQMVRASFWTALAAALLAAVLGSVFAGRLSQPIAQLAEGARRLAAGDFSQNINVRSRNEIGELANTFNLMTAEIRSSVERLRKAAEENRQMFTGTVTSLAAAIDAKDPYTAGHSERVAHYAQAISQKMGLSDEKVEIVRLTALMHDVGKIGIEDRILGKQGPLTDEEFEIMKTHTTKGAVIMSQVPQLGAMIPGLKYHHENVDGSGYPEGLKGEAIPWTAKIVSVADTFDAMTTNRPYQKAMEINYVLTRMRSFVGKKFESHIVEALIKAYEEGLVRPDMKLKRVFDPGDSVGDKDAAKTDGSDFAQQVTLSGVTNAPVFSIPASAPSPDVISSPLAPVLGPLPIRMDDLGTPPPPVMDSPSAPSSHAAPEPMFAAPTPPALPPVEPPDPTAPSFASAPSFADLDVSLEIGGGSLPSTEPPVSPSTDPAEVPDIDPFSPSTDPSEVPDIDPYLLESVASLDAIDPDMPMADLSLEIDESIDPFAPSTAPPELHSGGKAEPKADKPKPQLPSLKDPLS